MRKGVRGFFSGGGGVFCVEGTCPQIAAVFFESKTPRVKYRLRYFP